MFWLHKESKCGFYINNIKGEESRIIKEYAKSEELGIVVRKSNINGVSPKEYARALFEDGVAKGWMMSDSELAKDFKALEEHCASLRKRENISIQLINKQLKENKQFNEEINKISEEILEYCKKLKLVRDKIIAHTDRDTYNKNEIFLGNF